MMRVVAIYGLMVLILVGVFGLVRRGESEAMWIAFQSDRDGISDIYRMNADGSNVQRLTQHPNADTSPFWSPDGEWIGFRSVRDVHNVTQIYRMRVDGSNVEQLTFDMTLTANPTSSFSADGQSIIFEKWREPLGYNLYKTSLEGGSSERLTAFEAEPSVWPVYSPDGQWISFVSVGDSDRLQLFVMDAHDSTVETLNLPVFDYISRSSWSPDSEWIVVEARTAQGGDLYRIRRDGRDFQQLTSAAGNDYSAHWSADGEWLVYTHSDQDYGDIYRLRLADLSMENLTNHAAAESSPSWSPIVDMEWAWWKVGGMSVGLVVASGMLLLGRRRV